MMRNGGSFGTEWAGGKKDAECEFGRGKIKVLLEHPGRDS